METTQEGYLFDNGAAIDPPLFVPVGDLANKTEVAEAYCESLGEMIDTLARHGNDSRTGKWVGYVMVGVFREPPTRAYQAEARVKKVCPTLKSLCQPLRQPMFGRIPRCQPALHLLDRYIWLLGWDFKPRSQFGVVVHTLHQHGMIPRLTFTDQDDPADNLWHVASFDLS